MVWSGGASVEGGGKAGHKFQSFCSADISRLLQLQRVHFPLANSMGRVVIVTVLSLLVYMRLVRVGALKVVLFHIKAGLTSCATSYGGVDGWLMWVQFRSSC